MSVRPHPLVALVNPLQGSGSRPDFSSGNCLPLVSRPFGMTAWSPQTDEGPWVFDRHARKLQGIRATHQPSPWMGDYGHFTLMPQTGPRRLGAGERASAYVLHELSAAPHRFSVYLRRYETLLELAATDRCAAFRFTFPGGPARIILQPFPGESSLTLELASGRMEGWTRASSGGVPENYALYLAARLDRPASAGGLFAGHSAWHGDLTRTGDRIGAYLELETVGETAVELRVATSFISVEQAWRNLERETGDRSFDALAAEGEAAWANLLSRIEIEGASDEQQRTFYSCLYRALLFPHRCYELDEGGAPIHYSPYDGGVHPGVLYTDNGFWDTHRTVYPFLSLAYPHEYAEIIRGWAQACKEAGWSPRWPSPGHRSCMISTHLNAVLAEAYVKGFRDWDVEAVYPAMLRDASEPGDAAENYGRRGITEYQRLGYVPADRFENAASCTQDYAYNDYCIAQVARGLGIHDDARRLLERAKNYQNTFDPSVGFMRGRNADGTWAPFHEFVWGGPYVEGGAWQCSWAVPHDPAGLIDLVGGPDAMAARLDRMLALPPRFEVGSYGFEIHEMTEMACVDFGQYAHSNQPVHHVLYLYACAGYPDRGRFWLRQVMDKLYSPDAFAGDEDNGEMACWYLLNALGLYGFCPGHPTYLLGTPLFPQATIRRSDGRTLIIRALDSGPDRPYVRRIAWNGAPHAATWIGFDALAAGGTLEFAMHDQPAEGRVDGDALPFSLSREPA